jgi:hypothetical protein
MLFRGGRITICEAANKTCPLFPGAKKRFTKVFRILKDSPGLPEENPAGFRQVRDEIIQWIDLKAGKNQA